MDLPYVDAHRLGVAAPPETVWAALLEYADTALGLGSVTASRRWLTAVLGTEPRNGFAVAESSEPSKLVLRGRHRFSDYRLSFEIESDGAAGSQLRAVTHAAFPGMRGRGYRLLVISSGVHERLTRGMLRSVAARALSRR